MGGQLDSSKLGTQKGIKENASGPPSSVKSFGILSFRLPYLRLRKMKRNSLHRKRNSLHRKKFLGMKHLALDQRASEKWSLAGISRDFSSSIERIFHFEDLFLSKSKRAVRPCKLGSQNDSTNKSCISRYMISLLLSFRRACL